LNKVIYPMYTSKISLAEEPGQNQTSSAFAVSKPSRDISGVRCYGCNKLGHYRSKCPEKLKKKNRASDEKNVISDLAQQLQSLLNKVNDHYIARCSNLSSGDQRRSKASLDSACTGHYFSNNEHIDELRPCPNMSIK